MMHPNKISWPKPKTDSLTKTDSKPKTDSLFFMIINFLCKMTYLNVLYYCINIRLLIKFINFINKTENRLKTEN